jgi:hypothetical protein
MFTQFFARQRPDSTKAKPAFMKNTSIAATKTQTVSTPVRRALRSAIFGIAGASAGASAACSETASARTAIKPAIRRGHEVSRDLNFIVFGS